MPIDWGLGYTGDRRGTPTTAQTYWDSLPIPMRQVLIADVLPDLPRAQAEPLEKRNVAAFSWENIPSFQLKEELSKRWNGTSFNFRYHKFAHNDVELAQLNFTLTR